MKKIIIGILIISGLFCVICLCLGYTIPQRDKNKDWVFFPENKDPNFEIEKTGVEINPFLLQFPALKGSIILNQDENEYYTTTIVNEQYEIIKTLPKAKSFYIDSLNQRIILEEISANNEEQLFGYDLKNFEKSEPLIIQKYPIKETFKEFVIRKNHHYVPADSRNNEQWTAEYLADKPKEIKFYKKLSAVTQVLNMYENLDIYCYADDSGQLFDIEDSSNPTEIGNQKWESLYLLFPKYNEKTTGLLPREYIRFVEADKPSVYSNFFKVGVYFSALKFKQLHINYYSIKFGNKSFNFKDIEDDDISFEQLNIPKSETDTLYMNCNKSVYRVYLKSNRKK